MVESCRLLDHINECLHAWVRREEMKPVDERVPLPTPPDELDQKLPETAEAIEQFNKQMRSAWLKAINIRCKYCHTTLKQVHFSNPFLLRPSLDSFRAGAYFRHIKTCQPPVPDHKANSGSKELDFEKGHVVQKIMKEKTPANAPQTPKETKTRKNPAPNRPRRLKSLEDASLMAMTNGTVIPAKVQRTDTKPSAPVKRKAPSKTVSARQPKSAPKKTPALRRSASQASESSIKKEAPKSERSHREQLTDLRQSVDHLKARQDSRRVIKKSKVSREGALLPCDLCLVFSPNAKIIPHHLTHPNFHPLARNRRPFLDQRTSQFQLMKLVVHRITQFRNEARIRRKESSSRA